MKITKSQLKQIIKEEMFNLTEMYDKNLFGDEGQDPEPPGKKAHGHASPMMDTQLASGLGNPSDWVKVANTLRQMSKVWRDGEDGAILQVAADILQGAADQVDAQDPLMGGDTDPLYDTTRPLKLGSPSRMDVWALKNKLGIGK